MYTVADIEDQIVAVLKASDDLTKICPTVESYGGQLDALAREVRTLTVFLPAVFLLYARSEFSEAANQSFDESITFTAVVIDKNLRGLSDLKAGAYGLLQLVRSILIGNDLGMSIEPIHPLSVESLVIQEEMAVYAFDFKTSQSLD